jgi:parallel beta helix pectate lyase-like protein
VGEDSSGGTIQHTTGVGIALTNTFSPSFTNMNIQSTARSGIAGTSVTNFTFNNGTINNSGTAAVAGDADANIAFNSTSFAGAQTKTGNNISGTLTVKGNVLSNGFAAGLDIQSDAGTVTNANVSNNTVTNPGSGGSGGTAGISFVGTGNASTSFSLDNATY